MTDELKPCPFCGGEAEYELSEWNTSPREHDICCKNGCAGVSMTSKQQAITAWDTRAEVCKQPPAENIQSDVFVSNRGIDPCLTPKRVSSAIEWAEQTLHTVNDASWREDCLTILSALRVVKDINDFADCVDPFAPEQP